MYNELVEEQEFSIKIKCGHCQNTAPMELVAKYSQVTDTVEDSPGNFFNVYTYYELLRCPACREITLEEYDWCDELGDDPTTVHYKIRYPIEIQNKTPLGMPEHINKAYLAAQKVRAVDANAYAVLLGRVLELICKDRSAKGKTLAKQLEDLSKRGEIPEKLSLVTLKLRNFRNIGAHASLGELTEEEIPLLEALSKALLEYIYTAPYLVKLAEQHYQKLMEKIEKES